MKKFLSLVFVLAMVFSVAACGGKQTYKLGMGVVVSLESSAKEAGQVDATVAAVVTDKDGKIVECRLDAVQNKASIGTAIEVKNLKTKMELGDDYGMAPALNYGMDWNKDGVVKEWYDQAKAFETFVKGKTATEVANMPTQVVEGKGYVISADADLLAAGCTIQITDFKAAVVAACNDEQGMTFEAKKFTLGVAATSFDDGSTAATAEANGTLKLYSDFAASVVADGKIIATLNDAIQPSITFDAEGTIVEKTFKNTKRALKEEYGMAPALNYGMDWNKDGVVKEWYLQSAEFSKYVVGKTAQEVLDMPTQVVEGKDYVISSEADLLAAGCTIQITSIKAVVAKSVNNAR